MRTLELGDAFDQIRQSQVGKDMSGVVVIDTEHGHAYGWGDLSDVFDMGNIVHMPEGWLVKGCESGVFTLWNTYTPIVVYFPVEPVEVASSELPLTAVEIEHEGHRFDPIDMTWTCDCGETIEADAPECGECGNFNPFLGMVI